MGAFVRVPLPVFFAEHLGFQQAAKCFAVEELVPEPAVKALAVGVLPRCSGRDVERFEPALLDPVLHGLRHELRAVVASDELRWPAAFDHGGVQDADDILGFHPPLDFQSHQFTADRKSVV